MTWTVQGSTPQTATGFVSTAGPSTCSLKVFKSSILSTPFSDAGAETLRDGYLDVVCGDRGSRFHFVVDHVGDVRDWSVGMFTVTEPGLYAEYISTSAPGAMTSHQCIQPDLAGIPATVSVESASGGPLPLPKMVTDDFARTLRFDFVISGGMLTDYYGVPCDFPVTAQVSLHLTQTAADYVHDPNALCSCQ